jgi:hypothetical protein
MTYAELAKHARADLAGGRPFLIAFGALVLALGLVGIVALAASAAEQPIATIVMIGIIAVVLVLPGALMVRAGLSRVDAHPLVVALERRPENVRSVTYAYQQGPRGYRKLAVVQLADGSSHSFEIPS